MCTPRTCDGPISVGTSQSAGAGMIQGLSSPIEAQHIHAMHYAWRSSLAAHRSAVEWKETARFGKVREAASSAKTPARVGLLLDTASHGCCTH